MKAQDFKNKVKDLKEFLRSKKINISLVTKTGIETFKFSSLKSFGNKILELEKMGAGFAFSKVGNSLVERRTVTERELTKWVNQGVWTKIYINASTLKF